MTVFVDELARWGWKLRGRMVASCHMFTDTVDLTELHEIAQRIGMKRAWFQDHPKAPHYDVVATRRFAALAAGAVPLDRARAVAIWRARRALVAAATPVPVVPSRPGC